MKPQHEPAGDDRRWLDEPRNVDRLVYGLYALCGLMLVADAFYGKHPHFGFEAWFGFYAWYGFVACVVLVIVAKFSLGIVHYDDPYCSRG